MNFQNLSTAYFNTKSTENMLIVETFSTSNFAVWSNLFPEDKFNKSQSSRLSRYCNQLWASLSIILAVSFIIGDSLKIDLYSSIFILPFILAHWVKTCSWDSSMIKHFLHFKSLRYNLRKFNLTLNVLVLRLKMICFCLFVSSLLTIYDWIFNLEYLILEDLGATCPSF